ncbi:hypothetical protein Ana3638_16215 [Anaerocolumna sedimenticola]|uniref:Uncharacterized protein n=2 Tax=Anaerocolumna sedimenticola TaxID=2696063 RepID=A0A6P1TU13_9FIRM|nr:hypothetical protein Ana3638_16215 [Anaerocolumna sedimenticola]
MKNKIDLCSLIPIGHIETKTSDKNLYMMATKRLTTNFDKENMTADSYVALPDKLHIPFRIDLTVKLDAPGLYLLLGRGHISFGTLHSDNRRLDDMIEPNYKPRFYHNHIPMNEFVDISILYASKAMQILINGEERFYSEKEKYMKAKTFKEYNDTGFTLKITGEKYTNIVVKSLLITEYNNQPEIKHNAENLPKPLIINEATGAEQKPTFDNCISLLPKVIQEEIKKTDNYLRSLKPMKFKRQIEKYGNKITYLASDYGFSYQIYPSNDMMNHSLSWYIITGSKPEFWHRKDDRMEMTLNKLIIDSPDLAEGLFSKLSECIGCCSQCIVKTPYEFNGKKKITCHGRMKFKMCLSDFDEVRTFINAVNELVSEDSSKVL